MYHDWECEDYSQAQANLLADIIKSFQLQNKVKLKTTEANIYKTVTCAASTVTCDMTNSLRLNELESWTSPWYKFTISI